jgi:hypothetical protein
MKKGFRIGWLLAIALLAAACNRDGFSKSDLEITDVCLKVKGIVTYSYAPGSSQIAFNRGRKEFRAGTDTMSDYFLLKLSEVPHENGQVLTGFLQWTTDDDIVTRSGLSFKVERIGDDGTVWLWCAAQKITVVMKMLN